MESKFTRDTSVRQVEPDLFEGTVNRDWWIVLGPNGGFLAAMIVRAMAATVGDDERTARSLTIHYAAAPAAGAIRIRTTVERAGRSLTTLTARMEQGERLIALATAAFSRPRGRAVDFDDTERPEVGAPEDYEPIGVHPAAPPFSTQWEFRPAIGARPFSGGEKALTGGWMRLVDPAPIDAALVSQMTDAWLPAVFSRLETANPVPTIDLTIHFRSELPLPPGFVLCRFVSRLSRGGFMEEDGELWSSDGVLIAQSRQLALMQAPSHD